MPSTTLRSPVTRDSTRRDPNWAAMIVVNALQSSPFPSKTPDPSYLEHFFGNLGVLDQPSGGAKQCEPSTGLGAFFKVPPEVRHIIYRQLIASSDLAILGTSRRIHEEAKHFIFEDGICHMTVGIPKRPPLWSRDISIIFSRMDLTKNIQRVSLRLKSGHGEIESGLQDYEFLNLFTGCEIPRKTCTVLIIAYPSTKKMVRTWILRKMKQLTGFESVVLDVGIEWIWEPSLAIISEAEKLKIQNRLFWGGRLAKRMLGPTLGPGYFSLALMEGVANWNKKALRLNFNPQRYLKSELAEVQRGDKVLDI